MNVSAVCDCARQTVYVACLSPTTPQTVPCDVGTVRPLAHTVFARLHVQQQLPLPRRECVPRWTVQRRGRKQLRQLHHQVLLPSGGG